MWKDMGLREDERILEHVLKDERVLEHVYLSLGVIQESEALLDFFFFFAAPQGLQDLSSLTRDRTQAHRSESA